MRLSLVVQLGFSITFLLMFVIGLISKLTMDRLTTATEWVSHTHRVQADLNKLEKILVDAETGQRGFIFTRQQKFLEPYNQSKAKIEKEFLQLSSAIKDNPAQLQRLSAVEDLSHQKLEELATTITLKRMGKEKELRALVISGKGKQLMDRIRKNLAGMIQVEEELLTERKRAAKQAELIAHSVSIGATFTAIIIGLLIVFFIARKVVQPINQVASAIASSSTQIAATVEEQERTAAQQAASVNQTTTTMDELGASSRQAAQQAEAAATGAQQALSLAADGNEAVEDTLDGMAQLRSKVSAIAEQIVRLSEQTTQIGSISNLVSDLANQTNMLALNAAVEAVRAGEHGKGFGVVASEIRKLADQSKRSAEKINALVGDIQNAINSTVIVTDDGTKTVEVSVKTVKRTADAFTGVAEAINNIALNSQQISLGAKQQAIAIQQVVDAMNALNQAATQTASGISQTRTGTQQLNEAALTLKRII